MFWKKNATRRTATILIDGKPFDGKHFRMSGGIIEMDGVVIDGEATFKMVEIKIEEDESIIEISGDLVCGNIQGDVKVGGDLKAKNITGAVEVDGDLACGDIAGNVVATGDVRSGKIGGNITAGGDVSTHR